MSLWQWREAASLSHDDQELAILRAAEAGFKSGGARGLLENKLAMQKKFYAAGKLSPFLVAETAALLGEQREALKYLRQAYQTHDTYFPWTRVDRSLRILRADPEFQQLLQQAGLPPVA